MVADLRRGEARPHALLGRAPHGFDVDVVPGDDEALARHMPRHLRPHGPEPDHAGAPHRIACISHMDLGGIHMSFE